MHICVDGIYWHCSGGTYDSRNAISAFLDEHLFFGVRVNMDEVAQNVFLRERAVRVVALIIRNYQVVAR